MNINFNQASAQRGAVLVVALIMLLLLTIIGLSSMRGTSLQEGMASNLRESSLSYQSAEAALRAGEQQVRDRFASNTLSDLSSGAHGGFSGMAQTPSYDIVKLANLRTSTQADDYDEGDIEGVLVRIDGVGSGLAQKDNGQPITQTLLRSTFLVEQ